MPRATCMVAVHSDGAGGRLHGRLANQLLPHPAWRRTQNGRHPARRPCRWAPAPSECTAPMWEDPGTVSLRDSYAGGAPKSGGNNGGRGRLKYRNFAKPSWLGPDGTSGMCRPLSSVLMFLLNEGSNPGLMLAFPTSSEDVAWPTPCYAGH